MPAQCYYPATSRCTLAAHFPRHAARMIAHDDALIAAMPYQRDYQDATDGEVGFFYADAPI